LRKAPFEILNADQFASRADFLGQAIEQTPSFSTNQPHGFAV